MQVAELRDALSDFNQAAAVSVATPSVGKPHLVRAIRVVGHLDHPGEVKDDATIHAVDVVCDPWDFPSDASGKVERVSDLVAALAPFPGEMHVRIAMPVAHDEISHRMLDVVSVGRAVGSGAGSGVQLLTENFDNPLQVVKAKGV